MGLKYYSDMKYAPLSDLMKQDNINTENQLVLLYDSSWKACPDTCRNTVAYVIFYQGGTIGNVTHVPGPVSQSITESEYNASCNTGMALAHLRFVNS